MTSTLTTKFRTFFACGFSALRGFLDDPMESYPWRSFLATGWGVRSSHPPAARPPSRSPERAPMAPSQRPGSLSRWQARGSGGRECLGQIGLSGLWVNFGGAKMASLGRGMMMALCICFCSEKWAWAPCVVFRKGDKKPTCLGSKLPGGGAVSGPKVPALPIKHEHFPISHCIRGMQFRTSEMKGENAETRTFFREENTAF